MFVWPKMGYVQAKIRLMGQFDWRRLGNYLQPCHLQTVRAQVTQRMPQQRSVNLMS